MEHGSLTKVYACIVDGNLCNIIRAEITVFHDYGQPGRPVAQLLNLDRLLNEDAVGAQPAPRAHSEIEYLTTSHMADVRLRVDGERRFFPGSDLKRGHIAKGLFRGKKIGKRIRQITGMALAPETVLHQVDPFDQRVVIETGRQEFGQLA